MRLCCICIDVSIQIYDEEEISEEERLLNETVRLQKELFNLEERFESLQEMFSLMEDGHIKEIATSMSDELLSL